MARRFPIADLRTLTARALESGDYTPGQSGRVRAVPDTRTIRYYTTLGLIDGPAELQGRTAFYSERHLLQLVAIKRLQAADQTLSDIQRTLVGLTDRRLKQLARLPDDFWPAADKYLERQNKIATGAVATAKKVSSVTSEAESFWDQPAALPVAAPGTAEPTSTANAAVAMDAVEHCVRIIPHPDLQLLLGGDPSSTVAKQRIDLASIQRAAEPLLRELARQGLLDIGKE